uniref:Extracellular serine/threonine protein kinase four-jointed-like n=1 Tax=Dermatophagoides pteronyssinus TaxID=6956 RepID=A0A6P6XZP6_DERPT
MIIERFIFVIVFVVVVVVDSTENIASSKLIEDQIYWSSNIDRSTNSNNDFDNEIINWIDSISKSKFIRFESGCGRMQNRLLITDQGDKICARYRHNNEQIFGEYYSFLLARILQISNVLPTTLITYNVNDRWKSIANLLSNNQTKWKTNKTIVLTKYLKNLKPTLIPRQFRSKSKRLYPIYDDLNQNQTTIISELIQWSDLIILDYLTGNTDRMINNMINENWNPQMMENPVHNLLKQQQQNDDKLIFIDNESGLFHGYRLLKRYEHLHRSLLDGLCIFRRSTIENLEKISKLKSNQFLKLLQNYFDHFTIETDKNSKNLMPTKNFNILRQRIKQILKQVEICKEKQFS